MLTPNLSLPRRRLGLICCLYLAILAQSLHPAVADADGQLDQLAERATAYWDARVADDPITMYEYEAIGVQGIMPLRVYVRKGGGLAYKSAVLKNVQRIDDDEAVAVMDVEYRVRAMGRDWFRRDILSKWVLIDGEWYHGEPQTTTDSRGEQDGEASN